MSDYKKPGQKTGNPSSMRKMNKNIIYDMIFRYGKLSRVQLATMTALRAPTVSNIIRQLEEEGCIINCGKGENNPKGGPQPELYRINCTGKYFIGIDIAFELITGVMLDSDLCEVVTFNTEMDKSASSDQVALAAAITNIINCFCEKAESFDGDIAGIGISASGLVDHERGIITLSAIKSLNNFNFKEFIEEYFKQQKSIKQQKHFKMHHYIDNDINIMLADLQSTTEELSDANSIACYGIRSSGVGMSIVTGGTLYRGNHNISGNITLFKSRKSIEDILTDVANFVLTQSRFDFTRLGLQTDAEIRDIDENCLYYAIDRNDEEIIGCIKETLHGMNECIGMLQRVLDTEYIVIACSLFEKNDELFNFMVDECNKICSAPYDYTKYVKVPLKDVMFAYCAARCVYRSIYEKAVQIT